MPTYIIEAKRSPVGKFGGSLSSISATDLAARVTKELISHAPALRSKVDEVIIGNALPAGLGQNPARIIAVTAGLSEKVPAFTVNKVCGSGLKSVILGHQAIQSGEADLVIAGGTESMSRCPYYIDGYRFGVKLGDQTIRDGMIYDGLMCVLAGEHMGMTAENVARKYKITRYAQDSYALESHKKALIAIKQGLFKEEIVPIIIGDKKNTVVVEEDEQPRRDTSIEKLSRLKPVFKETGTVTAGNSSSINDGASILLLASEKAVKKYSLRPKAVIRASASCGCSPKYMGLGSYYAAELCLKKMNLKKSAIDLWELNEAFASQSIAVNKLLGINPKRVNIYGGAIALGHPIGASGAKILTTLVYALKRKKLRYGLVSLCIGGGQGIATIIENL